MMMLPFLTGCSGRRMAADAQPFQKMTGQKSMMPTPQDSVMSLLHQSRLGDGKAYMRLADCYRDGFGVRKDFIGMMAMAVAAEKHDGTLSAREYIRHLPDGHEYKTLALLMDKYTSYIKENTDSVIQALRGDDSPEARTLLGFVMIDQGDTATARNLLERAANQDYPLAKLLLADTDWKGRLRANATKLVIMADRVPLAYYILGNLYYEPDGSGKTDRQLAAEYYMKAEGHAVLGRRGAERVLDYYRSGGDIQLTDDDVRRLELIVRSGCSETE